MVWLYPLPYKISDKWCVEGASGYTQSRAPAPSRIVARDCAAQQSRQHNHQIPLRLPMMEERGRAMHAVKLPFFGRRGPFCFVFATI